MHLSRLDQPIDSLTIRPTVKYGRRDHRLPTNPKHVYNLWRRRPNEPHSNIWKPWTIYPSDPTQTQSPNTTLPACATHPRHAAISHPGKSWAVRRLLSRQYPTTQPPPPPNIIAITDELNNLTLHPLPQRNEWVTGCLVCGKSYDQVIEETVVDYLDQTSQPGETVRERQIKRNAFIDGVQSGVFTFIPPGVSQAAACDGMIYSINYNGQNSVTRGYALPLFENWYNRTIV